MGREGRAGWGRGQGEEVTQSGKGVGNGAGKLGQAVEGVSGVLRGGGRDWKWGKRAVA